MVDTIGLSTKSFVDNYRTPHTTQLHVIERFKLIDGGKHREDLIDPLLCAWTASELRTKTPLVDVRAVRHPAVAGANM